MNLLGHDLLTFWLPLLGGLAGLVGCFTGALALWLQYAGHRKDRPKVVVEVDVRVRAPFPPGADWEFRFVNTGRRPVSLRRLVFKLRGRRSRPWFRLLPERLRPGTLLRLKEFREPPRLDEQAAESSAVYPGLLEDDFFAGDVARAGVEDQSGRVWYAQRIRGVEVFLEVYSLHAVEEELVGDFSDDRATYVGRFSRKNQYYVIGLSSTSGRIKRSYVICESEPASSLAFKDLLQQAAAFRRGDLSELSYTVGGGCGGGGSGPVSAAYVLSWLRARGVNESAAETGPSSGGGGQVPPKNG